MDWNEWQSQLASELKAQRLPRFYVRRFLREIYDHVLDLQEAEMSQCTEAEQSMDLSEKLGNPKDVAEQAAAALFYRTWAGRHPWVAFLAGPPVLFVLGVTTCTLLMVGLASFFEGQTVETMPALKSLCYWAGWVIAFVPPIAASLLLCRMVYVSGRQRAWALGACAMVALLGGCLMVACIPPQTDPGTGSLSIGFGLGSTWQFDQAIAPLLIGLIFTTLTARHGHEPSQRGSIA